MPYITWKWNFHFEKCNNMCLSGISHKRTTRWFRTYSIRYSLPRIIHQSRKSENPVTSKLFGQFYHRNLQYSLISPINYLSWMFVRPWLLHLPQSCVIHIFDNVDRGVKTVKDEKRGTNTNDSIKMFIVFALT